ncbi:MFS transporter [Pseudoclavibacter sp. VKM Ac-2888]|uniref:MFS transporter n=1 Tax=Pseudoclavibacter sp. VKM Ac-2888 TaxID=2783830 RepID=UPI00188DA6EC|nr:MFS transporter [Pseudoclavibacter sp. VKM Ac-2888]MBF4551567.1 MFS transporter [Pseudoclavibacter sp. VKM Ac-2888]
MFESTTPAAVQAPPPRLRDAWVALTGLSAVFLFEMLDNSVLNVALPSIGRELIAPAASLQWVSGAYSLAFGGLMLLFGSVADRFGRRRIMLAGLTLLAIVSALTVFVTSIEQLIAVRALMGVAAAMTAPGSMALAFRLFARDELRVRALTVISTAGLVGLAAGPTIGGFALAVSPWQALMVANAPIAAIAFVGIRAGIAADQQADLHRDRIDVIGAILGTATVVGVLLTPTLFVAGADVTVEWSTATVAAAVAFVVRARTARRPLLDLRLVVQPQVASGLAYKAAAGLAMAGLSYLVTVQLQLAWGWSPALAAIATLPQVVVLLVSGRFVGPVARRLGLDRAAWMSATAVVAGLAVFALLGRFGYAWILLALVLVAAGMRIVGAVAGNNVLRGLPENRTSIGAALVDTASEIATAAGITAAGTILAAHVAGTIATVTWTPDRLASLQDATLIAGLSITALAAALVAIGIQRSRRTLPTSITTQESTDV